MQTEPSRDIANGSARQFELRGPAWQDHPQSPAPLMIEAFGRSLRRPLDALAAVVFDAAALAAPMRPNVTTVARSLNRSARTLEREFALRELPPPHRLVVLARWLALAHGTALVGGQTRTTARVFGFSSTQDFCRASWREIHMSVQELRTDIGFQRLIREVLTGYGKPMGLAFCREMATARRDLDTAGPSLLAHSASAHSADACD